ncbi:O-methyltransferase [Colletotrichum orbiculare MAFF 240422]|uniref:O-methyltransferase n=1 Tax=Colletotrichum orbiculare (strain 104-T / ATCC 96160 / CBS 514.97 / LARS 414 / MAFF 240422) TaxID=1213857 RepID=N4VE62_COLOR|nr:O-methyltransferase [Colletotrichum orbiculare MAFF 240422]
MENGSGNSDGPPGVSSTAAAEFLRASRAVLRGEFEREEDRLKVLEAAYEIAGKVETPWDTYVRLLLNNPAVPACLKVLKDLKLFARWDELGNEPMTSAELAGLVEQCDPALLHRLLRVLAANSLVEQVPVDKFKMGPFCSAQATSFGVLLDYYSHNTQKVLGEMPHILAEMGYRNPVDGADTVFQRARGYEGDLWSYLREHPERSDNFNMLQEVSTGREAPWLDLYPHEALVASSDPGLPLLVDVGGGIGHDLMRFHDAYPGSAARMYLADLPGVVAANIVPDAVNKVGYDFFTPQPIKHAKAYYLHHVIHDWSDEPARKILEMQKSAMKPGYSRLLIHDQILDDHKSQLNTSAFDIVMMVFLAGRERTEKQWLALVESAGLRVVRFWKKPPDSFSVIELELP